MSPLEFCEWLEDYHPEDQEEYMDLKDYADGIKDMLKRVIKIKSNGQLPWFSDGSLSNYSYRYGCKSQIYCQSCEYIISAPCCCFGVDCPKCNKFTNMNVPCRVPDNVKYNGNINISGTFVSSGGVSG